MRMSRMRDAIFAGVSIALALTLSPSAFALDAPRSPTEAYRQGLVQLAQGDSVGAVSALEFAAERGVLGAQLKLGNLYARGEQTPRDDGKAFLHYSQAADTYADISPSHPVAPLVARAFVALGDYYESGVPSLGLKADAKRAADLRYHAASYFGDVDAQYELARTYLAGNGTGKNVGLGINWLVKAAKKQHLGAQAALGEIFWRGDLVRQRPGRGLALLMLARERARTGSPQDAWIARLAESAWAQADAGVRQEAEALTLVWGIPEAVQIDLQDEVAVLEQGGEAGIGVLGMPRASVAEPTTLTSAQPMTPEPANGGVGLTTGTTEPAGNPAR